jgi:hypothetical protein
LTADLKVKKGKVTLWVCNTGTEADSYSIMGEGAGQNLNIYLKIIKPGKCKKVKVSPNTRFTVRSERSETFKNINL